jgi:hypothetical protein
VQARGIGFFVEVKRGSRSGQWHVHTHALAMVPRGHKFDLPRLWDEWAKCTQQDHARVDARVTLAGRELLKSGHRFASLDTKQREKLVGDLLEVCKYSLKFGDLSASDVVRVHRTLKGRHLRRSWGELRRLPDESAGGDLTEDDGRYVDHLFRWLDGSYRLLRSEQGGGNTPQSAESIDLADCPF